MNIRRVIEIARKIADQPGVVVDRKVLLSSAVGSYDLDGEAELLELARENGLNLQLVDIGRGVHHVVRDKTNLAVVYNAANPDTPLRDAIYGYVLTKRISAIVVYRASLNYCWRRFTVMKELAHLYSETTADSILQAAVAIAFAAKESRQVIPTLDADLDAETAALYIALEVMIPWRLRQQFYALKDAGATCYQIAKAFMVPQTLVNHFMSDWNDKNTYAGLSYQLNSTCD